ncbi:hypothetical protein QOZ80_5AG0406870 [Eleusine coracana subsp. coracana]|nr:hypothetical protein QOZ80_5AG0406870 [Eleusine coracana subsp. coracana]
MQTSKTRNGSSDALQRTSPRTPRSSRVAKTGGNETDSTGVTPTRTPMERSPKVIERRSPRSPITEKKRPSRLSELESRVSQLQDELKKAKEQLSASEARRRQAQQEAEEAKKQEQNAISKVEDLQRQLSEFSAAEDTRIQELRKIAQERDRAWESELDAVQKQQSVDASALSSAMAEIQRLKQQLEATAESDAARAKQCEYAETEIEGLKQEMEIRLATIEGLKVNVGESDKAAAEANALAAETKQQLETAKCTIDSLVAEGVHLQEYLKSKDVELSESKARIASLEEDLKNAQAEVTESLKKAQDVGSNMDVSFGNPEPEALKKVLTTSADANGSCGSPDSEIEQLRTALEVAEIRYQEEQTRMCIETKTAYEMLEKVKTDCAWKVHELEVQLKNKHDELMEAKAAFADNAQQEELIPKSESVMQPELEAKLMKSFTDITELKASLMDKENALQSMAEENETLRLETSKTEAELRVKFEAAVAELELAKAAEQDVRMRLGLVTEEADKSSRCAARASEQLDAVQSASSEMEAELRRLRVQSDQWRKAAEAAAAVLGGPGAGDENSGGNNGRMVERTGSLEPEYNSSIGGKLMSSPFSDEVDEESPIRRRNSGGVLRRMSGLWKKSPK